jgi:uncharacterized membrane protein
MTTPAPAQAAPYHITMFSFEGVDTAARVLREVKSEPAFEGCEIEAEAVVAHHPDGRIELHEKGSAGVGATLGVVTAGLVGLVTGPVLLLGLVALGGIAGGIAGHFAGQILPPDDLKEVGESLPPDSSAILAVVDTEHAACLVGLFDAHGARILDVPVETDLASVIREGITHHVTRG